jgi:hypothetical protein
MAVNLQAVPGTGLIITPDNSGNMSFSTGPGAGNVAMTVNANASVSFNSVTALNTSGGVITLPAGTGTAAVQGVSTNIVVGNALSFSSSQNMLITGIPSWIKRLTVMFNGIAVTGVSGSTNGLLQLGSGSLITSGYTSQALSAQSSASSSAGSSSSAGFIIWDAYNSSGFWGTVVLTNYGGNNWVSTGNLTNGVFSRSAMSSGIVSLSGVLDRINLTTVGTNNLTGGSINIMYE